MKADKKPSLAQKPSPFVVVPPEATATKADLTKPAATKTAIAASPEKAPQKSSKMLGRKGLVVSAIALGVGLVMLLPIPNYVTGEVEVQSSEEKRHVVKMPDYAGTVRVSVRRNDRVRAGDVVAEIESADLENQIAEAHQRLEEAKVALSAAEQQRFLANSQLNTAIANENIARDRAAKARQAMARIDDGGIPRTRQLERDAEGIEREIAGIENEIEGTDSEITGVEAEIVGLHDEIAGLERELEIVREAIAHHEELAEEGIVAPRSAEMLRMKQNEQQLERQIDLQASRIATERERIDQIEQRRLQRENLIEQKYQQIAAKQEQILEVRDDRQETSDDSEYDVELMSARRASAEREVEAAEADIADKQQLVARWQADLQRLQRQRSKLVLRAETAGTVLTDGLDTIDRSYLPAGEEILSVADLERLTAIVFVRQEEKKLVREGQQVRFRPRTDGIEYRATVEEISPYVAADEPQGKPMLRVRLSIDNEQNSLLPGVKGHAHIRANDMRVYQKIQHELGKLFDTDKYFPWLRSHAKPGKSWATLDFPKSIS